MTTRFAPVSAASGLSLAGLRDAGLKLVAYLALLGAAFAEAQDLARASQARWGFIAE